MSQIKQRLERLEAMTKANTPKTRYHFTKGIADGITGDMLVTCYDRHGKPLEGWHWIDSNKVLAWEIIAYEGEK